MRCLASRAALVWASAWNRPAGFMGPNEAAFGHPEYGGAIGFADPTAGIGFVSNRIHADPVQDQRAAKLIRALYQSLGY